jgi:hypothetical protein
MVTTARTPSAPPDLASLQGASPPNITVECGGQTFPAHKVIVCPQSQKIQDACDATAKVGAPHLRVHTSVS